jgi:hypothetical protein
MGMNLFRYIVPRLYPFFAISADIDIAHAHNQFLQVGVDLGIPGLIAYIALWLSLTAMLWQSWRLSSDLGARILTAGFAASLLGSFVFGLTDAVALGAKPGFLLWFLWGLITGHYCLLAGATDEGNGFLDGRSPPSPNQDQNHLPAPTSTPPPPPRAHHARPDKVPPARRPL